MAILPDTHIDLQLAAVRDVLPGARARSAADRAALTSLYVAHGARIHRFLRDLLGDPALAADGTQETFARAFRKLELLDDGRPAVLWLFGIARNVSLELRRARRRAARVMQPDGEPPLSQRAVAPGSPETELLGREAAAIVQAALDELSDDRRAMLLLRLDHGLPYEDIAKLMGFSLAKVKVEIHRAREVLRATMSTYGRGGTP